MAADKELHDDAEEEEEVVEGEFGGDELTGLEMNDSLRLVVAAIESCACEPKTPVSCEFVVV